MGGFIAGFTFPVLYHLLIIFPRLRSFSALGSRMKSYAVSLSVYNDRHVTVLR